MLDGGGNAAFGVRAGKLPAPAAQLFRRIPHDKGMAGEGKHFNIVIVITNGHDLLAGNAPMVDPALERVSLGTSCVEHIDNRKITARVLGAQNCDGQAAASEDLQSPRHVGGRAAEHGLPITVLRTEYPGRDLSIVDVLNAGCSKGHALERWVNYRGITREQVMAVGDNYNDIEMLAFAGHPFIMGNASEGLRSRGWTLTRSNAESGVAAAIEHVLYGKELEPVVVDQIRGPAIVSSL